MGREIERERERKKQRSVSVTGLKNNSQSNRGTFHGTLSFRHSNGPFLSTYLRTAPWTVEVLNDGGKGKGNRRGKRLAERISVTRFGRLGIRIVNGCGRNSDVCKVYGRGCAGWFYLRLFIAGFQRTGWWLNGNVDFFAVERIFCKRNLWITSRLFNLAGWEFSCKNYLKLISRTRLIGLILVYCDAWKVILRNWNKICKYIRRIYSIRCVYDIKRIF